MFICDTLQKRRRTMLKVHWLFVVAFAVVVHQTQCQLIFSSADLHNSFQDDPFTRNYWNWRSYAGPGTFWPPRPPQPQNPTYPPRPSPPSFPPQFPQNPPQKPTTPPTWDIDGPGAGGAGNGGGAGKDREPLGPDYKDPVPRPDSRSPSFPDTGVVDVDAVSGFPSGFPSGVPEIPDNSGFPNYGNHFPNIFNIFSSMSKKKPWWKGPNVCVERSETTEDEEPKKDDDESEPGFSFTTNLSMCRETKNKYECTTKFSNHGVLKTFVVKYKCCHGSIRIDSSSSCRQVKMKDVLETIYILGGIEFRGLLAATGLEEVLTTGNNTVFLPHDQLLGEFLDRILEINNVDLKVEPYRRRRTIVNQISSKELALNHITPGIIDLSDLMDEQILYSDNNNSTLRVNKYPTTTDERLVTINCACVRISDNVATNGVVHVIEGILPPVQYSVKEIIDSAPKLTNLRKILDFEQDSELSKLFKEGKHVTVLAPSDAAFEKLDPETKARLFGGDSCARNILRYHVIPHTVCSVAISGNVTTHNIEGNILNMERTRDGQLKVEGIAKIVEKDIVATNGVIHIIDTVILPDSGLHITDALRKHNLTKFEKLIDSAGLSDQLNSLNNATVFAPTDDAFEDPETLKHLDNIGQDQLKELVMYHTTKGEVQSCDLNNNDGLHTNSEGKDLRVNLYSTVPLFTNVVNRATINCARVLDFDEKACGTTFHQIDKLLIPPNQTILDMIYGNQNYSILSKMIKGTEVEELLKNSGESLTLFAPDDEAFSKIDEEELVNLLSDKDKSNEILKQHVSKDVLCCAGVGPSSWAFNNYLPTLSGQSLEVSRTSRNQVRVGRSIVTKCDSIATNGIVHLINRVIMPRRVSYGFPSHFNIFWKF